MRWNIFGSGDAGPSSAAAAKPEETAASTPAAPAATPAPAAPANAAADHADPAPAPPHLLGRYERTLAQEEAYQAAQYPAFEDVPGCMRLFDEFLMCYALLPQLRNMYRFGELHDCTYKFEDFKYCMSLKGEDTEARRQLWIKRRAEWWAKRRVGESSEDVWDARTEPLKNFPPLYDDPSEPPVNRTGNRE
ncbi:hypothetical protein Q8F55_006964 [Vanrija albida]|uniref:NADH dehydrogenase [ubiquinone] 1 beta subcomplex subunit 7 n=1 Tax=Vanrija albida TaxID=181172 RepID=A0ABR3PYI2_9TREE